MSPILKFQVMNNKIFYSRPQKEALKTPYIWFIEKVALILFFSLFIVIFMLCVQVLWDLV
jgi:hypothetical protein